MARWGLRGRGEELEQLILASNQFYQKHGTARIDKAPTPIKVVSVEDGSKIKEAYFEKKATVDFYGIVQGHFIVFDAKQTMTNSLPLKNIHQHQIEYMNDVEKQGGISFLLVEFSKLKRYFLLPYEILSDFFINAKSGGRKSIPLDSFPSELEIEVIHGVRLKYLEQINTYFDWKDEYHNTNES